MCYCVLKCKKHGYQEHDIDMRLETCKCPRCRTSRPMNSHEIIEVNEMLLEELPFDDIDDYYCDCGKDWDCGDFEPLLGGIR